MKLLFTKRSPYARKVQVVALEKGIALDLVEENLKQKSGLLVQSNPLGKIPTLVLDNGEAVCDSPVICEYLDGLKAAPALFPKEQKTRIIAINLAGLADGLMDTTVAAFMEKQTHPEHFSEDFIKAKEEAVVRCLKYLEGRLSDLKDLNIASIAIASAIGYIQFRLPHLSPEKHAPKLNKWFVEFSKRPSMQKTVPVAS